MALEIYPSVNNIGGTGKKISELKHAQWMSSLIQNSFVITGWTFPSPGAGLTFTITGGGYLHLVGYWVCDLTNNYSVTLTASSTCYIYMQLTRDGAGKALGLQMTHNTTGITPTDAVFLGTATTDGSDITAVDITGRQTRPWTTSITPVYNGTVTPLLNTEDVFDDVAASSQIITNGTNLYKQNGTSIWVYDETNHNWDALTGGGHASMVPLGVDGDDLIFGYLDIYKYDVSEDSWSTLQTWHASVAILPFKCAYLDGYVYGYVENPADTWKFYKQDMATGTITEITLDAYYKIPLPPSADYTMLYNMFAFNGELYIYHSLYGSSGSWLYKYYNFDIYKIDVTNSKAYLCGRFNLDPKYSGGLTSISPIGIVTPLDLDWTLDTNYHYYINKAAIINPENGNVEVMKFPRAALSTGGGYIDHRWVAGKTELYRSLGTAAADAVYKEIHGHLLCNITRGTVGKSISVMAGDEYGVIIMQEGPFSVTILG